MKLKIKKIKKYWEDRPPQTWYSEKKKFTKEFYEDIEKQRYTSHYDFIPEVFEFNKYPGQKVLEVGCGLGTEIIQYAKYKSHVTGVDLTENAIKKTAERFKMYNLKGVFQTENAENLSFSDNVFDLVLSVGVFHHTPNTRKCVDEAVRVLKPGKKAIILLYSKGLWYSIIILKNYILQGQMFKMSLQKCLNKNSEYFGNSPLTKFYSKRGIKQLFKGYDIVFLKKYCLGPKFTKWFPRSINRFFESLIGNNWVIKVRKSK